METLVIRIKDPYDFDISLARDILKNGGLVAFPTETVYGLGAIIYRPDTIRKIFEVKGRLIDNPLIVHISSFEELIEIAYLENKYVDIIK